MSLPFHIDNGGLYDISDLTITTLAKDKNGAFISDSSTPPQFVPHGSNVSITHNMSISISQMTTENLSYLLFNDSAFNIDIALKLNYANAVPFEISTNLTMTWGAPLNNLTAFIDPVSLSWYNATHSRAIAYVSFINGSPFSLDGTMRLELVDNLNRLLGYGMADVPPQGGSVPVAMFISDLTNVAEARLFFDTSIFSYGPAVIPLA